jgi:hypothetical protein
MPNLRKRIEALQKSFPSQPDPKVDDEIMRRAEARVSAEDREICERLSQREEPCSEVTKREWEAVQAYDSAIKLECKRAGYRSLDEFQASYCGLQ